ncbi:kinesin-like protein KIN-1, partial [Tanacetum coccineum]
DATQDRAEEIVKDRYEATNGFLSTTIISADSSQFKREKLKKVEDLVQKLKTLNSDHNEAQTDYIASLCEKTNPNDIYISEILLASGLLLRDLGCFELHSSGHPINPELFLVLEHWTDFHDESSVIAVEIERLIFRDLVNEIVMSEVFDGKPGNLDDATQDRAEEIVKDRYEATNGFLLTTIISADSSQFKREKLKKVEDLVQKLKRLNSDHNEAQTDYIASLCEKTNPNDIYISEILLASGLLLRDLGCFEFHSSGHPINPELFLVLEHTRFSNLQKGKFHRKLIFDSVNEILVRKFSSPSKMMQNPRKLLSEVCLEIEQQQVHKKGYMCDLEEGDDLKRLLWKDVLKKSENWTDFHDESPVIAVEVERLIFRDLVNEIVMSELNDDVTRRTTDKSTDAVNSINGTIITYGQTGAGKTYTMEGGNILETGDGKKGLLPRVVDELFEAINLCGDMATYKIKLSMVEIYMERVRDLFDLSKDNIQILDQKGHRILLYGVTEMLISDGEEALKFLSSGIANRAVGETRISLSLSLCHSSPCSCIMVSTGKLVLVDLAGSEKVEKTGAEGRVFEEAFKSLSALGNVINALTSIPHGKANDIPYHDSKLTRYLQDALGGSSHTALLCCCSPSLCNSSESLSTLRFGARAKHIKASLRVSFKEDMSDKNQETSLSPNDMKLKVDEKDEQYVFSFDKVFYDDSGQADVYEILGRPIVRGYIHLVEGCAKKSLKLDDYSMMNSVIACGVICLDLTDFGINEIVMSEVFDGKPGNLGKFCK